MGPFKDAADRRFFAAIIEAYAEHFAYCRKPRGSMLYLLVPETGMWGYHLADKPVADRAPYVAALLDALRPSFAGVVEWHRATLPPAGWSGVLAEQPAHATLAIAAWCGCSVTFMAQMPRLGRRLPAAERWVESSPVATGILQEARVRLANTARRAPNRRRVP